MRVGLAHEQHHVQRRRHPPIGRRQLPEGSAHDLAAADIQHHRQGAKARPGGHIGHIGHLQLIDASGWLGLVPSQNSSGGRASLGRITKRGDDYLRTLLIQGAKSAVMSAGKRDDPISRWLVQLTARVGWQKACVAMANKNARILWAVMTREQGFDARHVSVKPQARQPQPPAIPNIAKA